MRGADHPRARSGLMAMRRKNVCAVLGIVILLGVAGGSFASPLAYHRLVWSDEFTGDTLDTTKWRAMVGSGPEEGFPESWGNREMQYYRAENASVRDGNLVIRVCREDFENRGYTSARLTTSDLFSFTYGRVEACIKLPTGMEGLWPAFWLLPDGHPETWAYGGWAASGELDIMENRTRTSGEISAAAHFGGLWPANAYAAQTYRFAQTQSTADWHVYSLEWFPDQLIWYVDGQEYFRLEDWYIVEGDREHGPPKPYDTPFCILLNTAVGGNFDGGLHPGEDFIEAEMFVDWVRVYQ